LSIDDLANWLAKPEIKNNPTITNKKLPKTDVEWFDLMGKSISKKQKKTKVPENDPNEVERQDAQEKPKVIDPSMIEQQDAQEDLVFEEYPVGRDLERPHMNRSSMSKWIGKVPHPDNNPKYAFIQPIDSLTEYRNLPYMPQLIGLIRPKITEVLQTEFRRKDQIKSAIVALCLYSYTKRNEDGSSNISYSYNHERGNI
jgi:hypothetical protein